MKANPFAKSKAKVIGSFVSGADEGGGGKQQGSSSSTGTSNKKHQSTTTLDSSSSKSKKRSSSEEELTSYPLAKKKLANPASAGPGQPNVDRTAESSIRASLQMVVESNDTTTTTTAYLKPLPAGFFDNAPSEKDLKNIRDGYKELNKSGDELFKDKGFAQLVKSSVVKNKSVIDKKNKDTLPFIKPTRAEKSIEALEKEQDEREDSEEMKRQLEEFLKIEELKKQKEDLKGKSNINTNTSANNNVESSSTNSNSTNNVENGGTGEQQSESSSSDDDDELVIDWKRRGK